MILNAYLTLMSPIQGSEPDQCSFSLITTQANAKQMNQITKATAVIVDLIRLII